MFICCIVCWAQIRGFAFELKVNLIYLLVFRLCWNEKSEIKLKSERFEHMIWYPYITQKGATIEHGTSSPARPVSSSTLTSSSWWYYATAASSSANCAAQTSNPTGSSRVLSSAYTWETSMATLRAASTSSAARMWCWLASSIRPRRPLAAVNKWSSSNSSE